MSQPYAIVIPKYDSRRGIDVPFYIGERVYQNLPDEDRVSFSIIEAYETLFNDGSLKFTLSDTVRKKEVYLINQMSLSATEALVQVLSIIRTLQRCDAKEIVSVEPYLPWLRQDRTYDREDVSSRLIADLYEIAGADRVLTFHPHVDQAVASFSGDCHLEAFPTYRFLAERYRENHSIDNTVIVAPDEGATKNCRRFADVLGLPLAIIVKERLGVGETRPVRLIGNVEDLNAIQVDDVFDSGSTSMGAADFLMEKGAKSVETCVTHLGLTPDKEGRPAKERIVEGGYRIIGTDTIPHHYTKEEKRFIEIHSIIPILTTAMSNRIHGRALSPLFNG
jgi:ribose-phosphate pyrophosphokinase